MDERERGSLVTGGATGIGRTVARRLATRGDVVTVADIDTDAVEATAAELRADGLRAEAVTLDVRDVGEIRRVVRTWAESILPGTLVNNAGVGGRGPLLEVEPELFDAVMSVNLRGAFFVLQAAARMMVAADCGSTIVNLSSTSGFRASSVPMLPYDASKAAVRMMTASAARELGPLGIRVNAVAPGTVDTGLTRSLATSDEALERMVATKIPARRMAQPEEVAAAVDWLSSQDSSYTNGHVLVVDGGWLT